jgi:hypothetical protein
MTTRHTPIPALAVEITPSRSLIAIIPTIPGASNMLTSYPAIQPYEQHLLPVGKPHQLYVEVCGNPEGQPILFVHGGPGSGCSEDHWRYFDPNKYRIILFDQRGAGRSTPHADLGVRH